MIHSRLLRYLDEVVRAGSIRQAAERLNVAPSAINRQILDLEKELGTAIFQRLPRGLRLTSAGEILIAHVRQTLKDYDRVRERMLDLEGLRAGHVVVAAMNGLAEGVVPAAALRFRARYPRVKISVRSALAQPIVRGVEEGDADLGLAYNLPAQHGLHVVQLFETQLGAVVGARHPLATQTSIRLSDCTDYPLVTADETLSINRILRAAFTSAQLPLVAAFETNSVAMMKGLVRDGRHVTFLSRPDVAFPGHDGNLVFLPLRGTSLPSQPLALVHRANATPGIAASLFAEELRAALEDTLPRATATP